MASCASRNRNSRCQRRIDWTCYPTHHPHIFHSTDASHDLKHHPRTCQCIPGQLTAFPAMEEAASMVAVVSVVLVEVGAQRAVRSRSSRSPRRSHRIRFQGRHHRSNRLKERRRYWCSRSWMAKLAAAVVIPHEYRSRGSRCQRHNRCTRFLALHRRRYRLNHSLCCCHLDECTRCCSQSQILRCTRCSLRSRTPRRLCHHKYSRCRANSRRLRCSMSTGSWTRPGQ